MLVSLVGEEWYEPLKTILHSSYFKQIGYTIANLREIKEIYPPKELVFRAFKETLYSNVKVVMIAMDPYNNDPFAADGLAFSNSRAIPFKISPSLRIILEEIDNEYPEWKDSIENGKLGGVDLSRWAKQGVFLYNTALTVEKGNPGSHIKMWELFTSSVIEALNKKNDLVWILLGREARKFKSKITNPSHAVLEAPHPAAEAYSGGTAGFYGSGIFRKANEELKARNKSIIYW